MVMDLLYCFGHAEITGLGNVLKTSVDWLQHPMWIVVLTHPSKLRVGLTVVETSIVRVPTELYIHRLLLLDPIEKKESA